VTKHLDGGRNDGELRVGTPPPSVESAHDLIGRFVDPGSFLPHNAGVGAVLTGTAKVNGRTVAIVAHDRTTRAASAAHFVSKIIALQEYVWERPCPILYLFDEAPVAHLQAVFAAKRGIGHTYYNSARLANRVPQIGVLLRSAYDAQSFLPALCDALVLVDGVRIGLADPGWMPMLTGEVVDAEQYGDAKTHATMSGLAHAVANDPSQAIDWALRYLSFLPDHAAAAPRHVAAREPERSGRSLEQIVPGESTKPFDMTALLREFIDSESLHEIRRDFAPEMITAFARLGGRSIGIVANNSRHRGGLLFPEGCDKSAEFVELCSRYGIPLVFVVDTPGFMPGTQMERRGSLRAAARLYRALADATVPRITVLARKAHSAGLYAMCGPPFRPDACLALPTAIVSVFGEKLASQLAKHLSRDAGTAQVDGQLRTDGGGVGSRSYEALFELKAHASNLVFDDIVTLERLRDELSTRLERMAEA
jgi:acetyl-CoA carboxylase carboxyltransferase component